MREIEKLLSQQAAVGFVVGALLMGIGLSPIAAQKKPAAPPPYLADCPAADLSLDAVRVLNTLHSRLDELERKIDARPLFITDQETEDLHRRLLSKPFPVYDGTIVKGKTVVLTPRQTQP